MAITLVCGKENDLYKVKLRGEIRLVTEQELKERTTSKTQYVVEQMGARTLHPGGHMFVWVKYAGFEWEPQSMSDELQKIWNNRHKNFN